VLVASSHPCDKFVISANKDIYNLYAYCDFYQFLVVSSLGSPIETRKSGISSVFSLFNLKEKSRFWSEDVIHNGKLTPCSLSQNIFFHCPVRVFFFFFLISLVNLLASQILMIWSFQAMEN